MKLCLSQQFEVENFFVGQLFVVSCDLSLTPKFPFEVVMERGQIVTRMTLVFTSSDGDPSRHPARPGISCHSTDWTPAEGEVLVKKLKQMAVELAKLHKFNNPSELNRHGVILMIFSYPTFKEEYELDGLPTGYRLFTKKRTNSSNMGPKLDYAFFGQSRYWGWLCRHLTTRRWAEWQ